MLQPEGPELGFGGAVPVDWDWEWEALGLRYLQPALAGGLRLIIQDRYSCNVPFVKVAPLT